MEKSEVYDISPEIKGVLDNMLELSGFTIEEFLIHAIFTQAPNIITHSNIDKLKLWLVFNEFEKPSIDIVLKYYGITKKELFLKVFNLT
ncbi:MAG: hypothetical protein OEZ01_15670 [Candidatus Heimdallarchaeota archaeon]|nr:hypothetical protein [Candidatus Heimdallarchaeota archaeon]MDH5647448.1 hypothetical protein [Candidatus Heimdallarchaeota archaeon]